MTGGSRDARTIADVGRRARLELTFERRADATVLAHAYAEPPLRVGRSLVDGVHAHVILASSAPGVFGGDTLEQTVTVGAGASVRLRSQSALQVHPAPDGSPAIFASRYRVSSGGCLDCEWDPVIPFHGARLDQRIAIDLDQHASLFWSDAVMNGREARGERWQFARLAHELRCLRGGSLLYLERYAIEPALDHVDRRWIADTACYFGTVLIVHPRADRETAEHLHRTANGMNGVRGAADLLEDCMLLVRLAAESGPAFHETRARVAEVVRAAVLGQSQKR